MANVEQNLREIAKAKGLKLSDIADRVGTTVSNLLSSVKGNPTVSKLEDIAAALQVSVSELLTKRPEAAQGIVIIGGETYQISKPATAVVQIPAYERYDALREEVKEFIKKAIEDEHASSKVGLLETMEVFSLVYDPNAAKFYLTLCYADGKTSTLTYDKFEYCDWKDGDTDETVKWTMSDITEDIINDIEGYVPCKLQAE